MAGDTTRGKGGHDRASALSRRRMLQGTGIATVAALAGCTETGNDGPGEGTLRSWIMAHPDDMNLNSWDEVANSGDPNAHNYWGAPKYVESDSMEYDDVTSGTMIDLGHDEAEAVAYVSNLEIESPEVWIDLNEDLTFWDGTPIDAEKLHYGNLITQYASEEYWADGLETTWEVIDDYRMKYTYTNDEGEPTEVHPDLAEPYVGGPEHPDFIESWVEEIEDANNIQEATEIENELGQEWLTPEDAYENGWATGPFEFDPEDWNSEEVVGHLRDDYPLADEFAYDTLQLHIAPGEDRQDLLLRQGDLDFIPSRGNHETVEEIAPDSVELINTYPTEANRRIVFDHEHKDLGRRSVRQAIKAAVPWHLCALNGWGEGALQPSEYDVSMPDTLAEEYLGEEFLDSLFDYPVEKDFDLAAQFLEADGYEKQDGTWVDPNGEPVSINFVVGNLERWILTHYTTSQNLRDFGFQVDMETVELGVAYDRIDAVSFDMSVVHWNSDSVFDYYKYWPWGAWNNGGLLNFASENDVYSRDYDVYGAPTVSEAPVNPSEYDYINDEGETEEVDIIELCDQIELQPTLEESREPMQTLARHANYNLSNSMLWASEQSFTYGNTENFRWPDENTHGASVLSYDRSMVPNLLQQQD